VSLVTSCAPPADTSWREDYVPRPASITIDDSDSGARARGAVRPAQLYYALWDTGRPEYVWLVVLDLAGLTLLSSLAMGALVEYRRGLRRRDVDVRLANVQAPVWQALEAG
jgi:hypothetical protein